MFLRLFSRSLLVGVAPAVFRCRVCMRRGLKKQRTEPQEKVLRIGLRKLTTIDPAPWRKRPRRSCSKPDSQYDYLIEILPNGTLEPSLATDWGDKRRTV